jgi:hypothetical protein
MPATGQASPYQNMTHEQLYAAIKAGDPDQVDTRVAAWKTVADSTQQISTDLAKSLAALLKVWDSPAGREYQRRVALIGTFASSLSTDQRQTKSQLETLSANLKEAKSKLESPASVDDHDKTIKYAAAGASVPGLNVPGAIVGGAWGFIKDNQEKDASRERMVQVITTLAGHYTVVEASISDPTPADPELPKTGGTKTVTVKSGPKTTPVRTVDRTGTITDNKSKTTPDPIDVRQIDQTVQIGQNIPTSDPSSTQPTTALLSNDGTITTAAAAGAAGAGALMLQQTPLTSPTAGGVSAAGLGTGVPAGGVLASAGYGATTRTSAGTTGTAGRVAEASASGSGTGSGSGQGTNATVRSGRAEGAGRAAGARTGSESDEDQDEYTSWLTEDEMVWGDDHNLPSSVIGGPTD